MVVIGLLYYGSSSGIPAAAGTTASAGLQKKVRDRSKPISRAGRHSCDPRSKRDVPKLLITARHGYCWACGWNTYLVMFSPINNVCGTAPGLPEPLVRKAE